MGGLRKILLTSVVVIGGLSYWHVEQQSIAKQIPVSELVFVDGDTVHHGEVEYRLMGFDTPETYRPKCAEEKALGLKAKARLAQIVEEAGQLDLRLENKLDRYDRHLAVGMADGQEVGAILVAEGLARPYDGGQRGSWCI